MYEDETLRREKTRLHMLRQQWQRQKDFRRLADCVSPLSSGRVDYLGAFAVTAGIGVDPLVTAFEEEHDDFSAILVKAIADRFAEAMAEWLHLRVRRDWGYGHAEIFPRRCPGC